MPATSPRQLTGLLRGLVQACHPLPTLAVTVFATAYALAVGLAPERVALLAAAVLAGQLSIGWLNDGLDAGADVVAGRADKPVARGEVSRRAVLVGAGVALVVGLVLGFSLGVGPGVAHALVLAGGWAYDLGLKSTPASGVPYLVAFGSLPAVASTALPGGGWPAAGVVAGSALLGLAAHFANTVGDAEADRLTGVRGLPQLAGPVASMRWTAVLVVLAALALLTAVERTGARGAVAYVVLAAGAGLAVVGGVGAVRRSRAAGAAAFRSTLAAVALVVAGFLLAA
jgi:4-hydroxybenzoate polyprenyltransferase